MPHYRYLIVGGGMAADAAVRGIRAVDSDGPVGLIGAEPDPPYERPPLSKGLWKGMALERIWRGTAELGVELHLERAAVSVVPGARIFPPGLARFLNDYYREHGVDVRAGALVSEVRAEDSGFVVRTQGGEEVAVDGVVAGLGIRRNTELARGAGLEVDDQGIVVDEFLRTSDPDIFAAGDVASFPSRALGRRVCVEHEDNANTMGVHAGQAMAGELAPYDHLPFFYSDLFDLGYEAVGETDPRFEVVEDWEEPYRKGVLYYLAAGRVRGVLLWNVRRKLKAARQVVASTEPVRPQELKGRIPM